MAVTFVLDAYAARSCPVKTFNAFDRTLKEPALDHSLRESFQGGQDQRDEVLGLIVRKSDDVVDLRPLGQDWIELEAAALKAMSSTPSVTVTLKSLPYAVKASGAVATMSRSRTSGRPSAVTLITRRPVSGRISA